MRAFVTSYTTSLLQTDAADWLPAIDREARVVR